MLPLEVLLPAWLRTAPVFLTPVPLIVTLLLIVTPPARSSEAPASTVTPAEARAPLLRKTATPCSIDTGEATPALAAPKETVPVPRFRSVAPEVVVTAAVRFS